VAGRQHEPMSRFGQIGSVGSNLRNFCHRRYAVGASPHRRPGVPGIGCCTASIDSVRIVLMQSWSRFSVLMETS